MAIQVGTQLPPESDVPHHPSQVPRKPKEFADIINMVSGGSSGTEIEKAAREVENIHVPSLYDLIADNWKIQDKSILECLLRWGDMEHKYKLLNMAAQQVREYNAEPEIPLRILTLSPNLVSYVATHALRPTVLHIAAYYESNELVSSIFTCAQTPGVVDFEATLVVKQDKKTFGKTPLALAVDNGLDSLVRKILQRSNSSLRLLLGDYGKSQEIFNWAITNATTGTFKALIEFRPSDMTVEVPRRALDMKGLELLNTLQDCDQCHHLFYNHGFMHSAVAKGKLELIGFLLEKFPRTALELDSQDNPPLFYNSTHSFNLKKSIRSLIVPHIMRQISSEELERYQILLSGSSPSDLEEKPTVSEVVRALIAEPSGNEISLSLGGFGLWASSAPSFLSLIKGSKSSKDPSTKPLDALLRVEFEQTLIHVDIPVPNLPKKRSGLSSTGTLARSEVQEILKWLTTAKKVTGIYELSIRDSCYLPHNEEVIGKCLAGFDVEVLDWRRLDLSLHVLELQSKRIPEAHIRTCPNLRELNLYASGWPSLHYWTSDEVLLYLASFSKLKQVNVFVIKEFVGSGLSGKYTSAAQERFDLFKAKNLATQLHISCATRNWSDLNPQEEPPKGPSETTAVEVTGLASFIDAYEALHRDFTDEEWRKRIPSNDLNDALKHTPYVKVAVIDNGVDPGSINCHSINGASFVPASSGESNWWYIKHSHGTKMAKIITELNPQCKLLVAKVGDLRSDLTPGRVVKAIKWAVAAGADIISMMKDAIAAGVVFISSTHGEGQNTVDAGYPAQYQDVFAISSANGSGTPSAGTNMEHTNYLFHAEKIVAKTDLPGLEADGSAIVVDGPSVATAIAAGVASLILSCDRFALIRDGRSVVWENHSKLKREIVERVFDQTKDGKYVRPWMFFTEDQARRSWGEGDSVLKWIVQKFPPVLS